MKFSIKNRPLPTEFTSRSACFPFREFNETRNLTLTRNEKPSYEKYEISRNTRFTQKWIFTINIHFFNLKFKNKILDNDFLKVSIAQLHRKISNFIKFLTAVCALKVKYIKNNFSYSHAIGLFFCAHTRT